MKKRYLKAWIEKALIILWTMLLLMILSINDFEICLKSFVIIGALLVALLLITYILAKYGKSFKEQ